MKGKNQENKFFFLQNLTKYLSNIFLCYSDNSEKGWGDEILLYKVT